MRKKTRNEKFFVFFVVGTYQNAKCPLMLLLEASYMDGKERRSGGYGEEKTREQRWNRQV